MKFSALSFEIGEVLIHEYEAVIIGAGGAGLYAALGNVEEGVWPCENHFECARQCPRSILITKRINQTKNIIKKYRTEHGEKVSDK